jgi:hypothetical protein
MDRGMKLRLAALAFAAAAVSAFWGCSNPIDILDAVTVEVKTATNKYLLVNDVGPEPNATAVSPSTNLTITFDRAIDPATVTSSIVFIPAATFTTGYNSSTKTLTISPSALEGGVTYTVTLTSGLKGKDNSDLKEDYSWSFTTANMPSGSFTILGSTGSSAGYSRTTGATLLIRANALADKVYYSTVLGDFANPDSHTWYDVNPLLSAPPAVTLPTANDTNTVYMQFAHVSAVPLYSSVVSATIVEDQVAPAVTVGTVDVLCTPHPSQTATATITDANGIVSYGWAKTSGPGTVSFSNASGTTGSTTTSVSANADGSYQITLTATDAAGNPGTGTGTFQRDTQVDAVSGTVTGVICTPTPTRTLNGSASDAAGISAWAWSGSGLTFGTPGAQDTSVSGTADGDYTATLTVTDGNGNTGSAAVAVKRDTVVTSVSAGSGTLYLNIDYPTRSVTGTASDAAGITGYAWSGTGLGFSPSNAAATTISASAEGTYTASLTATDAYGNTKTATRTVIKDITAPAAPTFNSSTTPTPTILTEPQFAWTTGGGGGPYDIALYNYKGATLYSVTMKAGYAKCPYDATQLAKMEELKVYPLPNGTYTFGVSERDSAGNHSAEATKVMVISPTIPVDGAVGVRAASVTFSWQPFGAAAAYTLFIIDPKLGKLTYAKLSTNSFTCPTALTIGGTIQWYVEELKSLTYMPGAGVYYTFTTVK